MANSFIDGPQSCVNRGANNHMQLVGLIRQNSADLVGISIGSAQTLGVNGRYGKGRVRFGTWNVRTMEKRGKLESIKRDMSQTRLNVLGLSEVRWKESRDLTSNGIRMICMAAKQGQGGAAVLLIGNINESDTGSITK